MMEGPSPQTIIWLCDCDPTAAMGGHLGGHRGHVAPVPPHGDNERGVLSTVLVLLLPFFTLKFPMAPVTCPCLSSGMWPPGQATAARGHIEGTNRSLCH